MTAPHLEPFVARPETRAAVFLDRDGTVIEEVNYLSHPDQVQLLPGAAAAIRKVNERGIPVVVVTNQAGVARGFFSESRISEVHVRLDTLLAESGARIDAYYACPHHPEGVVEPYRVVCACRKPKPGLLCRAALELGLDLSSSCMIGDKLSDLEAGALAGCRSILVRTGYGRGLDPATLPASWAVFGVTDTLFAAINLWFRQPC